MTVRLEQVNLVIRRALLDAVFPGGSAAFVKNPPADVSSNVSVDSDSDLVAVSASDRTSLASAIASLLEIGATFVAPDSKDVGEMLIVEGNDGATPVCSWLRCTRDPDGAAFAEYRDTSMSPEAVSARLLVGVEGGHRTWLDFESARLVSEPLPSTLEIVANELVRREWVGFDHDEATHRMSLYVNAGVLLNLYLQFFARENADSLVLQVRLPGNVAEEDRSEIGDFLLLANWGLKIGGFDIDQSDGEVIYRIGIPVKGQSLTQSVVSEMIDCAISTVQRYADGLLRVVRGRSPREIIDDIDRNPRAE
jgi:hypothetical protein